MTVVGKLYFVFTSFLFLFTLSSGNWRFIILSYSIPALIVFIASIKFIDESPRYLIATGRISQGIEILNKMG